MIPHSDSRAAASPEARHRPCEKRKIITYQILQERSSCSHPLLRRHRRGVRTARVATTSARPEHQQTRTCRTAKPQRVQVGEGGGEALTRVKHVAAPVTTSSSPSIRCGTVLATARVARPQVSTNEPSNSSVGSGWPAFRSDGTISAAAPPRARAQSQRHSSRQRQGVAHLASSSRSFRGCSAPARIPSPRSQSAGRSRGRMTR